MNKLNKFVTVLSKIIAIFFWIGCGFLFVGLIASVIFGQDITALISRFVEETPRVNVHGLEIVLRAVGPYALVALTTLCIAGIVTCGLHAMIFRNINLIFRTADGKTKYSKGASPFQPEIVRMVREIGIFCIVIPVFELIVSLVLKRGHGSCGPVPLPVLRIRSAASGRCRRTCLRRQYGKDNAGT